MQTDEKPVFDSVEKTERQVTGTISFNEAAVTFNNTGITFGGLYNGDGLAPVWD